VGFPVSSFQMRIVLSLDAEASIDPSCDHITEVTSLVCSPKEISSFFVTVSQRKTSPVSSAVASFFPSGDHEIYIVTI
jgi:hypothetical protein